MNEIPWAFLGAVIGALIVGLFARANQQRTNAGAQTIQELKQPAEDVNAVITVTDKYLALFDKHIALSQSAQDQSVQQTLNAGRYAATIAEQATTIVGLIADKDGMPTRIAEQVAALLLKSGYILEQRQALTDAGVAPEDQPVEPPDLPLTPLQPRNLLEKLANEKEASGIQAAKLVEAGEKLIEAASPADDPMAGITGT